MTVLWRSASKVEYEKFHLIKEFRLRPADHCLYLHRIVLKYMCEPLKNFLKSTLTFDIYVDSLAVMKALDSNVVICLYDCIQ